MTCVGRLTRAASRWLAAGATAPVALEPSACDHERERMKSLLPMSRATFEAWLQQAADQGRNAARAALMRLRHLGKVMMDTAQNIYRPLHCHADDTRTPDLTRDSLSSEKDIQSLSFLTSSRLSR